MRRIAKRVLGVSTMLMLLFAFAGPVAAHGLPVPGAACNQGTERAFWDIGASLAVPMYGGSNEPWCMTMFTLVRH